MRVEAQRRQRGLTLTELMVVLAILATLSAIALPIFVRNARRAKSSEAVIQIRKIYTSSRTYILESGAQKGIGTVTPAQFPEPEGITPAGSCCTAPVQKCTGGAPEHVDWNSPTWVALQFSMEDPHYYRYAYDSTGSAQSGAGSAFTVRATGDLNCDSKLSTFEMIGVWSNSDHDVHGSAGVYIEDQSE